jgi:hypothetical protein
MFILCDINFMKVAIATVAILSVAGVPNNCQYLTRQNYKSPNSVVAWYDSHLSRIELNAITDNPGGAPNNPTAAYTENRGELDKHCVTPHVAWGLWIFEMYVTFTSDFSNFSHL